MPNTNTLLRLKKELTLAAFTRAQRHITGNLSCYRLEENLSKGANLPDFPHPNISITGDSLRILSIKICRLKFCSSTIELWEKKDKASF